MPTRTKNVIAMGDSIAAGVGTPDRHGWLQRLRGHFYEINDDFLDYGPAFFHDLAVPGETSEGLLRATAGGEVKRRHRDSQRTLSIVALGGQQPYVDLKEKGQPDIEGFATRLGRAAASLLGLGDLLYIGIPAPNTHRMLAFSPSLDRFTPREIEEVILTYERIAIKSFAEVHGMSRSTERQFAAVPLFEVTRQDPAYTHFGDATHPDEAGHERIFAHVQPVFDVIAGRYSKGVE